MEFAEKQRKYRNVHHGVLHLAGKVKQLVNNDKMGKNPKPCGRRAKRDKWKKWKTLDSLGNDVEDETWNGINRKIN